MTTRRVRVLLLDVLVIHVVVGIATVALVAPWWAASVALQRAHPGADAPSGWLGPLVDVRSVVGALSPWLLVLVAVCLVLAHGPDRWLLPGLAVAGTVLWSGAALVGPFPWPGPGLPLDEQGTLDLSDPGLLAPVVMVLALVGGARAAFRAAGDPSTAQPRAVAPATSLGASVTVAMVVGLGCTLLTVGAVAGHLARELWWGFPGDVLVTSGLVVALVAAACATSGHRLAGALVAVATLVHAVPLMAQWPVLDTHSLVLAPLATVAAVGLGWSHRPLRRAVDALLTDEDRRTVQAPNGPTLTTDRG